MRATFVLALLWAPLGCSLLFDTTPQEAESIDAGSTADDAARSRFVACETSADCQELQVDSLCECGQCSLPDTNCGSGRRWPQGDLSSLSETCVPRPTQIEAGFGHTCVVVDDGTVRCWGENFDLNNAFGGAGRIGDGTNLDRAVPTAVLVGDSPLAGVDSISLGNFHSCALGADEYAYCWGGNWFGALGDGTSCEGSEALEPSAVQFSGGSGDFDSVDAIFSGGAHTCAVRTEQVWCWGNNQHLQIGTSAVTACGSPGSSHPIAFPQMVTGIDVALTAAGGQNHTCVVETSGANEVRCFGRNNLSQLGAGPPADGESATPVVVQDAAGPLPGIKAVTAGYEYSCALDINNEVYCWGENQMGELLGATTVGTTAEVATKAPGLQGIASVKAMNKTTCALGNNGALTCGGDNRLGQLMSTDSDLNAPTTLLNGIRDVAVGASHICALSNQDEILCWGNQARGRLGNGEMGSGVITEPETLQQLCPVPTDSSPGAARSQ